MGDNMIKIPPKGEIVVHVDDFSVSFVHEASDEKDVVKEIKIKNRKTSDEKILTPEEVFDLYSSLKTFFGIIYEGFGIKEFVMRSPDRIFKIKIKRQ